MTNKWSLEYLAAQEYHKLYGDGRPWHELSPFEQNRLKREAIGSKRAVAAVDKTKIRRVNSASAGGGLLNRADPRGL